MVSIVIVVMQYPVKYAGSLSNVTVFGGAMANRVQKRHPIVDRPLVDWNLLVVTEPPTMIGALVGEMDIQFVIACQAETMSPFCLFAFLGEYESAPHTIC